jgi:hypothetical protein
MALGSVFAGLPPFFMEREGLDSPSTTALLCMKKRLPIDEKRLASKKFLHNFQQCGLLDPGVAYLAAWHFI